jgi:hypothetical protein
MKLIAFLIATMSISSIAHATVTETFKQTYPLAADGIVHLENISGPVEITGWDKSEVSLEAEKSGPDDEDLHRIHLVIAATPARLSIKTEYEKKWSFFGNTRGEVRYKLMVPAGASLKKIDVVNSDITVRGVRGSVELDSVNGRIEATGLAAAGRFDTVNGSVAVQYDSLNTSDKIVLDTVNGSCEITVPKDAGFEIRADTLNGSISCDLPIKIEKSGHHHLSGTVAAGGTEIALDSVNGGLAIRAK